MKKRVVPLLLAFVLLLTQLFPVTVLAQDAALKEGANITAANDSSSDGTPQESTTEGDSSSDTSDPQELPPAGEDSSETTGNSEEEEAASVPNMAAQAPFTVVLNPMGGTAEAETVQTNEKGFLFKVPLAQKEEFSLFGWTREEVTLPQDFTCEDLAALSLITEETLFTENTTIYAVWVPFTQVQPMLLGGPWDGTTAAEPSQVDGVYQIGSPEELAWFRNTVNAGTNAISAALTNDINLNNMDWLAIGGGDGYVSTCFNGSFDGAGHTISSLSINASYNHAGLFGYMNSEAAIVQNLSVNGHVASSSTNVGGIVGTLANGTIQNCSFNGSVTNSKASSGYAGGIVGYIGNATTNNPTMRGCVNTGDIIGPYAGGITAYGKYGTITECYNTGAINGKTRAGGIAGQMQNNFNSNYCYSIGALSGSTTAAEITDFLFSSATLNYCGYAVKANGSGTGVPAATCFQYTTPAELLAGLGSAYKASEGGYPVLAWQTGGSGGTQPTLEPKVRLQGTNIIFVEQGVSPNQTTITLALQDIKPEDVTSTAWETTVLKGSLPLEEIVSVSHPENNNNAIIVAALKGGGVIRVTVTVVADGNTYTDTRDVSVIPQITYASVVNADVSHGVYPVLGELATVQIYTLGGIPYDFENYPALNFKWRYNASGAADIAGATGKDYLVPDDGSFIAGDYLYVEILSGTKVIRNAMDTRGLLAAESYENPDVEYVEDAASIFDEWYGPLRPVYGIDENIIDMVKADLAKAGFTDIEVEIKLVEQVYGGGILRQDGTLDYFYADPNVLRTL